MKLDQLIISQSSNVFSIQYVYFTTVIRTPCSPFLKTVRVTIFRRAVFADRWTAGGLRESHTLSPGFIASIIFDSGPLAHGCGPDALLALILDRLSRSSFGAGGLNRARISSSAASRFAFASGVV